MSGGIKVPSIFTAVDKFTRPVRKMARTGVQFAKSVDAGVARLDRRINRFGRTIRNTLGAFGLFVGLTAGVAVVGDAVRVIADYEQANANLASVLGIEVKETKALQAASKQLGATTAFTAAEVAGLQTEFAKLGFAQDQILGMTQGTLALAAATRTELPQAAMQVGSTIRAFGLAATDAGKVADIFAASTSKSALDMEKLDVAMSKVAPVAKQFGFELKDTVAIMGTLANAGFDASTMATSTRSIILNLADANGKLAKQLGGPARNFDDITRAMVKLQKKGVDLNTLLKATDKRSVAAFATLLEGAEKTKELQVALEQSGGAAERMAKKQLDTLRGRVTILRSAYEGFILSLDEGNGSFSTAAKRALDVTAEILSMASGMATAKEELFGNALANRILAERIITLIKALRAIVVSYLMIKTLLIIGRSLYAAYSVGLGIATAMQWKNTIALKGNSLAMKAHVVTTRIATVAQKAFNMAMRMNPIGLVITGVVALAAGVAILTQAFRTNSREQRLNSEIQNRALQNTIEQRAEIDFLFRSLKKAEVGSDKFHNVLSRINQIQPGIVEKYNLQAGALENITRAENDLKKAVMERAKAEAIAQLIQEKTRQMIVEQTEGPRFGDKLIALFKSGGAPGVFGAQMILEQQSRIASINDDINALMERQAALAGQDGPTQPVNLAATQERINTERQESVERGELGINITDETGRAEVDKGRLNGIPVRTEETFGF